MALDNAEDYSNPNSDSYKNLESIDNSDLPEKKSLDNGVSDSNLEEDNQSSHHQESNHEPIRPKTEEEKEKERSAKEKSGKLFAVTQGIDSAVSFGGNGIIPIRDLDLVAAGIAFCSAYKLARHVINENKKKSGAPRATLENDEKKSIITPAIKEPIHGKLGRLALESGVKEYDQKNSIKEPSSLNSIPAFKKLETVLIVSQFIAQEEKIGYQKISLNNVLKVAEKLKNDEAITLLKEYVLSRNKRENATEAKINLIGKAYGVDVKENKLELAQEVDRIGRDKTLHPVLGHSMNIVVELRTSALERQQENIKTKAKIQGTNIINKAKVKFENEFTITGKSVTTENNSAKIKSGNKFTIQVPIDWGGGNSKGMSR